MGTRKRQGQNIYELFGRACPSCGGLGHVAVLPGKDLLQPLATATGLVRSAASARAEVTSPIEAGNANGRRRRGGRGRLTQDSTPVLTESTSSEAPVVSSQEAQEPVISRSQDPEFVAVSMTPEQKK